MRQHWARGRAELRSLMRKCMNSYSVVSNSFQLRGLWVARLLGPWDFPGKNAGVGCYFLPQGIFSTQGSNPNLLHCRRILYHWAIIKGKQMRCALSQAGFLPRGTFQKYAGRRDPSRAWKSHWVGETEAGVWWGWSGCKLWDKALNKKEQHHEKVPEICPGFAWICELVMDRESWHAEIHGVTKSRTRLSDWTELNWVQIRAEPTSPALAGGVFTTEPPSWWQKH